jgi:hypothetical protein
LAPGASSKLFFLAKLKIFPPDRLNGGGLWQTLYCYHLLTTADRAEDVNKAIIFEIS